MVATLYCQERQVYTAAAIGGMDASDASRLDSKLEPLLPLAERSRRNLHPLCVAVLVLAAIIVPMLLIVIAGSHDGLPLLLPRETGSTRAVVEVWETSKAGARLERKHLTAAPPKRSHDPPDLTLWLRPSEQHQSIEGFGGAITQASGVVWRSLKSDELRESVVESFFGESGLRASLARVPINSCDFAEASYSADDVAGDASLSHFDETLMHDEALLLPMVRAALSAAGSHLKLLASPWSPPAWMKTNGDMNGNVRLHRTNPSISIDLKGLVRCHCEQGAPRGLREEAAASWAAYISKWLAAFDAHGATVSLLTVQNEPLAPSPWEACYYDAAQEAAFVAEHLGPALQEGVQSNRHPPVTLLGFDDQKDGIQEWADALLGEKEPASQYASGVAYHWYAGDHFERLAAASRAHPNKLFLGTEATYELTRVRDDEAPPRDDVSAADAHTAWVRNGVWSRGEGYAHAIIGDLLAGSAGWIDWNVLLDHTGGPNHLGNTCDAPIIADPSLESVWYHPQYYYLGHFARFMPRGSRRIAIDREAGPGGDGTAAPSPPASFLGGDGTYNFSSSAVAYGRCPRVGGAPEAVAVSRPDGSIALVLLNCGDEEHSVAVGVEGGEQLRHAIPPHAIQTYVLRRAH